VVEKARANAKNLHITFDSTQTDFILTENHHHDKANAGRPGGGGLGTLVSSSFPQVALMKVTGKF
jgi:hypothetical protein